MSGKCLMCYSTCTIQLHPGCRTLLGAQASGQSRNTLAAPGYLVYGLFMDGTSLNPGMGLPLLLLLPSSPLLLPPPPLLCCAGTLFTMARLVNENVPGE